MLLLYEWTCSGWRHLPAYGVLVTGNSLLGGTAVVSDEEGGGVEPTQVGGAGEGEAGANHLKESRPTRRRCSWVSFRSKALN